MSSQEPGNLTVLRVQRWSGLATAPADTLRIPHLHDDSVIFHRVCFWDAATHEDDVDFVDNKNHHTISRKRKVNLFDAQMVESDEAENSHKRIRPSLQIVRKQTLSSDQFRNLTTVLPNAPETNDFKSQLSLKQTYPRDPRSSSSSSFLRQRMKERAKDATVHHSTTVWDPLLRQVDYSLTNIFFNHKEDDNRVTSTSSFSEEDLFLQHVHLIQNNTTSSTATHLAKYLNWPCSNGQGTFLHALVQRKANMDTLCYFLSTYHSHIDLTATNSMGQTPEELLNHPTLYSSDYHAQICEVFQSYKAKHMKRQLTKKSPESLISIPTEYDYYVYSSNTMVDDDIKLSFNDSCPSAQILDPNNVHSSVCTQELELDLVGACAYWKDNGELVLELHDSTQENSSSIDSADSDSNHENWIGNDYPEEEDNDYYYEDYDYEDDDYVITERRIYAYDSDLDDV